MFLFKEGLKVRGYTLGSWGRWSGWQGGGFFVLVLWRGCNFRSGHKGRGVFFSSVYGVPAHTAHPLLHHISFPLSSCFVGGAVCSCGRGCASAKGPHQLLVHPQIRPGQIKKRCRCAVEACTSTSRASASPAKSNRARLSQARLNRARSNQAQFDPIAGAVWHTHVHAVTGRSGTVGTQVLGALDGQPGGGDGRMGGRTGRQAAGRKGGRTGEQAGKQAGGRADGRASEWANGRTGERAD